jgi:hypothetical protein
MDSQPTFTIRNIAEPRKFVTKWAFEQDKKVQRKKAFSKDRDTKYQDNGNSNLNEHQTQSYGYNNSSTYFPLHFFNTWDWGY